MPRVPCRVKREALNVRERNAETRACPERRCCSLTAREGRGQGVAGVTVVLNASRGMLVRVHGPVVEGGGGGGWQVGKG